MIQIKNATKTIHSLKKAEWTKFSLKLRIRPPTGECIK